MIRTSFFLMLIMLVVPLAGRAQSKGEFRVYYGIAESGFLTPGQAEGAAGFSTEGLQEFGIRYIHHTITNLSLATGISYQHAEVEVRPAPSPQSLYQITTESLNMVSIPLLLHLRIGRYIFVNGGPLLDFQLTETSHDLQSGFGFMLGVGANYAIEQFTLFITPNVKSHALLPFEAENNHQRLAEVGLQFGVGYKF